MVEPGTDPMDDITCIKPCVEGDDRYFEVYDEIRKLEAVHAVLHGNRRARLYL
jgi:hypothetical protein